MPKYTRTFFFFFIYLQCLLHPHTLHAWPEGSLIDSTHTWTGSYRGDLSVHNPNVRADQILLSNALMVCKCQVQVVIIMF